jgi:pimeloyl-ACP methyl ester carboxylesterase
MNAAPSAFEMLPLFNAFRGRRPVFAPDLPGFGFSERGDRAYSPELYAASLREFVEAVIGSPVDAVALSTTSEFLARAALDAPAHFASLALLSPTGMGEREPPSEVAGDRLHRVFSLPVLGSALYAVLTSRASIRYFLNLNFADAAPVEMIDYAYATSHQPGARHAPFRFLSMKLFTRDAARNLYSRLAVPTLVLYDSDPNVGFEKLTGLLADNPHLRAERIAPTLGLPHWEEPEQTVAVLERFWEALSA